MDFKEEWIQGLTIINDSKHICILNVYLPYQCNENYDKYMDCIGKIESIVQGLNEPNLVIVGDFNANLARDNN